MDFRSFKALLANPAPPAGLTRPLVALWHQGKGEWDAAHRLVQQDEGEPQHDWVHAHLHRVEGDLGNAGYWYRRAKKPVATCSTDDEWAEISKTLLSGQA